MQALIPSVICGKELKFNFKYQTDVFFIWLALDLQLAFLPIYAQKYLSALRLGSKINIRNSFPSTWGLNYCASVWHSAAGTLSNYTEPCGVGAGKDVTPVPGFSRVHMCCKGAGEEL